jgi:hypothetical protein
MEPLLVPRLPDPVACLYETKAANREFTYFAGVLSIRDSPCIYSSPVRAFPASVRFSVLLQGLLLAHASSRRLPSSPSRVGLRGCTALESGK